MTRYLLAAALAAAIPICVAAPASAVVIIINQSKALAGNVTPGDAPGFPITLSQAGAYRFDSNLAATANKDGLVITAPDVTIDLAGFRLHGFGAAIQGITGSQPGATIRNGTITAFEKNGIYGVVGDRWTVESMQIVDNELYGVYLAGIMHHIRNSTISGNGADGVSCASCVVEGNVVGHNGRYGIIVNSATVIGNHIGGNESYGLVMGVGGSGFAHNVLYGNNTGTAADQVSNDAPLHPNRCQGAAC